MQFCRVMRVVSSVKLITTLVLASSVASVVLGVGYGNIDFSTVDSSNLPVVKTEKRQSETCPGVEEEVIYKQLETEVDGERVTAVLAEVVIQDDTKVGGVYQTEQFHWLTGKISLR